MRSPLSDWSQRGFRVYWPRSPLQGSLQSHGAPLGHSAAEARLRHGGDGKVERVKSILVVALSMLLLGASTQVRAALLWEGSCAGKGVSASGTLTTDAVPDAHRFYRITGIAGTVNGGKITGLQTTGTAIPGNGGYPVDNLVATTEPHLTMHGFGFAVSNGEY